jgi:hypothetical protein
MAETCCPTTTTPARDESQCPGCSQRGRTVAIATVQAQVAISLRELVAGGYRFCETRRCPIVYFAAEGEALHHEQLRERVFQKEQAGNVLVCYCFRYSMSALQHSEPTQRAAILADIVAGTRLGQCACELRNPQGHCCLGNVRQLLSTVGSHHVGEEQHEPDA